MDKLQIKINRADAELIVRSLQWYADNSHGCADFSQAQALADWMRFRIGAYWDNADPTDRRRKPRETEAAASEALTQLREHLS